MNPSPSSSPQSQPAPLSWFARLLLLLASGCSRLFRRASKTTLGLAIALGLLFSLPFIITSVKIWQQALIAVVLMLIGWLVVRLSETAPRQVGEYLHLFLAWLSIMTTLRYLYYRTSYTLNLDGWVNGIFSLLLYTAELYAIATLMLSYFQTLKLRDREAIDLSTIPQEYWFNVDVYIPTYNEDVEIVRKTVLAALALDYPQEKKQVYVLDDGRKYPERRAQLRQMCDELGAALLVRDNNDHAKAGNINTAMGRTQGDLVLILDCDHMPSRQFLQHTTGFFLNPKVALVQTPHWFYNPDPFERNLLTQGHVPVGNELFYKVIQKGNDFWNAAFFCGSAAVIRKEYVMQVGGIAVETVTEDCHTALRLHSLGYQSIYYDKIMVAGLAPEKFSDYIGQQVRWARGMAQILRIENPLFNRKLKLSLPQRLCYVSATSHFFFGFPRIMYALGPVLYLLFGINLIRGLGLETLFYAIPHILLAMNANYMTQKTVRFSFWNEIFEYAMAFQDGLVTALALVNPKLGSFNVTAKGVSITKRSFDWNAAQGTVAMVGLLLLSLLAVPFWLVLAPATLEAVIINAMWCVFNLVLLMAAMLVAFEQPQLRQFHRLDRHLNVTLFGVRHQTWTGKTLDISESGARIMLDRWPDLPDVIELEIHGDFEARAFTEARIVRVSPIDDHQVVVAVEFVNLTPAQQDALTLVLYSDVEEWYSQNRQESDRPFASLRFLSTAILRAFRTPKPAPHTPIRRQISAPVQIYIGGHYYNGMATAMNVRSLQVELHPLPTQQLQALQELTAIQIPVGVMFELPEADTSSVKLVAQLGELATEANPQAQYMHPELIGLTLKPEQSAVMELVFPVHLEADQGARVKALLKAL
ncbi:MAG: UDP-forming cellulose synthase catalytic subunit [Elainellaceae cyanobacterium]